jgi:hypothetical protein
MITKCEQDEQRILVHYHPPTDVGEGAVTQYILFDAGADVERDAPLAQGLQSPFVLSEGLQPGQVG